MLVFPPLLDFFLRMDFAPFDFFFVVARARGNADALVIDGAACWLIKSDDRTPGRRFSTSGFANNPKSFAFFDVKRNVMNGFGFVFAALEENL